ncbi:MAG TPA: HAD family hydrolase [Bacillus sp. (in: firmicutes)]|uniref:HAD family hydrolase n=1 Tax=Bacillus litorisediminis TaxID=2922713 RepID=UPI001FABC628|nr:HAD family hydrolase [Bacillus litorisediminis]HWO76310.1 HAD family hydrolase [Bacillus sp. (in: firmicutes)]
MIFATDLDRTLIFSMRALAEFNQSEKELIEVERTESHRSFISQLSYELLQKLTAKIEIIPVTTRTMEQYNRLSLPFFKKQQGHYITSNGAVIVTSGIRDTEWDHILYEKMNQLAHPFSNINELLLKFEKRQVLEVKRFQELYFCLKIHQPGDPQACAPLLSEIENMGWDIFKHRNKTYIMPPFLQKGIAIQYLQKKVGKPVTWAAGDSKLDYSLLCASRQSFVPKHGELALNITESSACKKTKSSGIKAAEEILLTIYNQVF